MLDSSVYQSIFDRSPTGEYLLSPSADPVILAVNDAFLKASGRSRQELVGVRLFEAFPGNPSDAGDTGVSALVRSFERVLATGESDELPMQRYPIRVVGEDGVDTFQERHWSAVNTPIRDEAGTIVCISHRTRDVTELWRMQEALRRGNERKSFQLLLADRLRPLACPQEIVRTSLEILASHLRVARVQHAEVDDAAGTFFIHHECVAPGHRSIAGESRRLDDFGPEIVALLRSGKPMVVHDIAKHPGTRAHVQAYESIGVRSNLALPLVRSGRLTTVLSIHHDQPREWSQDEVEMATDVAERTWAAVEQARAQQELLASEQLFRVMADAVPQIIWIMDNEGNTHFFNRQWRDYTGEPDDQKAPAVSLANERIHPDDLPLTVQQFEQARRLGTTFSVEHRLRRADGAYRWFLARAEPVRDPETGDIVRWFGSSTDIGALKEAEQALREADRRKDEFLATLAHELRNPLAPVANSIVVLRSPRATQETRTRMLDLMERQTGHLVRLVDDLLEVSRITRGKIDLQLERVDLRAVAQACVDAAASALQEARHEVSLRLPAQPVWVRADAARMNQVLDNLLNNAIKYTPPGGAIEVEVGHRDGRARLSVEDNGAGIPPQMLENVFELFAQVDHTLGRAKGGLGIGLALVRQLVALHGGEVGAASGGIDAGSVFTVSLPLAPEEAHSQPGAGGGELQATRRPRRVLVIDDNRDAADTMAAVISLCGHEVEAAYDGRSGLEVAERQHPDCVLLDIGMPGMDGHEVARALRSNPAHRHCLIVALTGWGQAGDRALTREAGFDAHLVKPAAIEALMELLESR